MHHDRRSYDQLARCAQAKGVSWMVVALTALAWASRLPAMAWGATAGTSVQQAVNVTPLVFDGVTVVDVAQGKLVPAQRVIIVGNRIQTVANANAVPLPRGALVVDARGDYLIPGLWDLHVHATLDLAPINRRYLLANGITGFRDPSSLGVPLDTLLQWKREILAGTRVGPPRQIHSGPAINAQSRCTRGIMSRNNPFTCVSTSDPADPRRLVDSLKMAGSDMLKMYNMSQKMYFLLAAEARRAGIPFGGHAGTVSVLKASDSGARIFDHVGLSTGFQLDSLCFDRNLDASVERCRPVADRFQRNGTWIVPTVLNTARSKLMGQADPYTIGWHVKNNGTKIVVDSIFNRDWLRNPPPRVQSVNLGGNKLKFDIAERVDLPILSGTDMTVGGYADAGFSLHGELALMVEWGLTPLAALRAATLNPARMLGATDSLGTVAGGKLADLVLLEANPLADITNTTTIRAVVANGRYYDRAAIDAVLVEARVLTQAILNHPKP